MEIQILIDFSPLGQIIFRVPLLKMLGIFFSQISHHCMALSHGKPIFSIQHAGNFFLRVDFYKFLGALLNDEESTSIFIRRVSMTSWGILPRNKTAQTALEGCDM